GHARAAVAGHLAVVVGLASEAVGGGGAGVPTVIATAFVRACSIAIAIAGVIAPAFGRAAGARARPGRPLLGVACAEGHEGAGGKGERPGSRAEFETREVSHSAGYQSAPGEVRGASSLLSVNQRFRSDPCWSKASAWSSTPRGR